MRQRTLEAFSRSRCIASETRRSHSIQQKVGSGSETRRSRIIQQKTHGQNSGACVDGHRAAVQERKRDGTRKVLPRTTTPLVVLKASATDEKTEQLPAKECGEQKIHEKRTKSFHEARRPVLTSTASRWRLERCMQHSADER